MTTPLSDSNQEDCLHWNLLSHEFSVKMAYWAAKKLKDVVSSTSSSSSNNPNTWKWIWSLHISHKIKILSGVAWKVSAYYTSLLRREVSIDPMPDVGIPPEDLEHALRDCNWAMFFWNACILRLQSISNQPPISLQDWTHPNGQQPTYIDFFCIFLWVIWKARNLLIFLFFW